VKIVKLVKVVKIVRVVSVVRVVVRIVARVVVIVVRVVRVVLAIQSEGCMVRKKVMVHMCTHTHTNLDCRVALWYTALSTLS
jgi:hypothetical protein